jgi:GH25 family lysozyme M1 (1,4-beta-N-acetylmuramidase)
MKYIPDFYHGDVITDWDNLKANAPFVIFKATEGTSFISPKVDEYIAKCESHKIPYWVYVFLKKGHELEQTKYMVSVCNGKVGQFFQGYVLDVEKQNAEADVQMAFNWLNKNSGTKTMIYTMYADYNRYKAILNARGSNCAWWEARYGKNDGQYSSAYPCHQGADLHQYTDKGTCPGIKNKCDLSRLTGNKTEAWFSGEKVVTEMPKVTADTIVGIMEGWEGLSRKDKSHKPIIDTYNRHKPLARGYTVTYTDNYCATTVSAAFIKADAVDLIGGTECSVELMIENCFKKAGIWEEDGRKTPKRGWIITYNWDDSDNKQPNDGWADHIGVVKNVVGNSIIVIEGNYGGVVREREIKIGNGRIRGYAVPKYATSDKPKTGKLGYTGTFPVIIDEGGRTNWVKGDGITTRKNYPTQIKRIQLLVAWITGESLTVDGKYGEKTEKAVKKAQKILKVTQDGKFGKQTLEAAKKYRK